MGLMPRIPQVSRYYEEIGDDPEGMNAWLKLCTTAKRVHHHCSVATNTHRCAHRSPNLGQVPPNMNTENYFKHPWSNYGGADLRHRFRMLAHYLAKYDADADVLLNGDIHQVNADRIGISRRQVKTVTYAFLYGAGDAKIDTFDTPK